MIAQMSFFFISGIRVIREISGSDDEEIKIVEGKNEERGISW